MKKTGIYNYLYIIPVITCIAFSMILYQLTLKIAKDNYELCFEEKKQIINLSSDELCKFIHESSDWDNAKDFYDRWVPYVASILDLQDTTICILADNDMNILNRPGNENSIFYNPFENEEFLDTIKEYPSGTVVLPYDKGEISFYFRWVPNHLNENHYLLTIGVFSVMETAFDHKIQYMIACLIILVALVNYIMVGVVRKHCEGDTL